MAKLNRSCGGLLAIVLVACQDEPDPCTSEKQPLELQAKECSKSANLVLLGQFSATSDDLTGEHGFSNRGVVLDDEYAYWSDLQGRILRTPKRGGTTDALLEPSDCTVAAIAVDDVGVYYGHNCYEPALEGVSRFTLEARLGWIEKSNGVRHELSRQPIALVDQIAVRDEMVYWASSVYDDINQSSSIHRAHRESSQGFDTQLFWTESHYMFFDLSEQGIVWFDDATKHLRRIPLGNTGLGDPLTMVSSPQRIFVANQDVYWVQFVSSDDSQVNWLWRAPVSGGESVRAFEGAVTQHVVTDGSHFYGAGDISPEPTTSERVYRWSPPEFEPRPLAAGFHDLESITMDDEHLFVIDENWEDTVTIRLFRLDR